MDSKACLDALAALGQETRLALFRLLVRAEPAGMLAGEVAAALGLRQNTASVNLGLLLAAGLVRREREGRGVRYRADMGGMAALLGFLMEDCCGGRPALCRPALAEVSCGCGGGS